jgi:hypothetical protein
MKKLVAALLLSGLSYQPAYSCDVCGCTSMGFGLGQWAITGENSIGLRGGWRSFEGPEYTDYFYQAELSAIYTLNNRWQLSASLPYLYAERNLGPEIGTAEINGIADANLMVNYQALMKMSGNSAHTLSLGGGLNLPSGRFENRDPESLVAPNFQRGSASIDFLGQVQYRYNYLNYVAVAQVSYLYNTTNRYDYRFGDQLFANLRAGHSFELNDKSLLMLYGSAAWEHYGRDVNARNFYQYGTGGDAIFSGVGLNLFWQDWWLGVEYNHALWNSSSSNYSPLAQFQVNLNYLF